MKRLNMCVWWVFVVYCTLHTKIEFEWRNDIYLLFLACAWSRSFIFLSFSICILFFVFDRQFTFRYFVFNPSRWDPNIHMVSFNVLKNSMQNCAFKYKRNSFTNWICVLNANLGITSVSSLRSAWNLRKCIYDKCLFVYFSPHCPG